MFDKEKFTPEFYDKLSDSEKKELVQVMLEYQLTDPLHITGLPKPVQNCIKSAVKSSAKEMKEETIMNTGENKLSAEMMKKIYEAYRLDTQEKIDKFNEDVRKIISDKDYFGGDDDILKHVEDTLNPTPCVTIQRVMSSKYFLKNDSISDNVREEMFEKFVCHRPTHVCDRYGKMWIDSLSDSPYKSCDTFLIHPRGGYKLFWLKTYLESKGFPTRIWIEPLTTFQLDEVIYWINPHVNYLEDINVKDSNILHYAFALDELVNYNDYYPISQMIVDTLKVYGPEMMKQGKLVGPNFNEDKKRLEKVIKKGRKRK